MYDFDFVPETNGLELSWRDTGGEFSRREARPVHAEELTTLGMGGYYQMIREAYEPKHPEPFMCVKHLAEFFGTGGACPAC